MKLKNVIMDDGNYYDLPKVAWHGCCNCGLKHKVEFRTHKGILQWKWTQEKRGTKKLYRSLQSPVELQKQCDTYRTAINNLEIQKEELRKALIDSELRKYKGRGE